VNGSCKHSSLLRYGNNYGSKKFYSTGPSMGVQFMLQCNKPGPLL
jgi:hypothetical protein